MATGPPPTEPVLLVFEFIPRHHRIHNQSSDELSWVESSLESSFFVVVANPLYYLPQKAENLICNETH
jgi:hypothetical protein